jgi:hypothetical protein
MQDGFSFGKGRFFMSVHQGGGESIAQIPDFRKKAKFFSEFGVDSLSQVWYCWDAKYMKSLIQYCDIGKMICLRISAYAYSIALPYLNGKVFCILRKK